MMIAALGLGVLAACNAITGAHDRFLEEAPPEDGGANAEDRDLPIEKDANLPPVDAGPTTIDIPITDAGWGSPNQATFGFDGGIIVAASKSPNYHPLLVPVPTPPIPTETYKVRARIFAPLQKEYGIFVRGHEVAEGFSAFVLSSRYSENDGGNPPANRPFLAPLLTARTNKTVDDPPSTGVANGQVYAFEGGHVWLFEIEVNDKNLHGTITREDDPTITSDMLLTDPTDPAERGQSFGFYAFSITTLPAAALLQLQLIY